MNVKLEELRELVEKCKKCDLWKNRNKVVFGEGPSDAEIMLIGLGPGYHENLQGRPFVGAAGKLLNKLLELAGLKREKVYICNVIKCYLPDNKPTEEQIRICSRYLDEQIALIKPKVIIPLGNVAKDYVFEKFGVEKKSMGKLHGKVFEINSLYGKVKIIPMYHPSAALRNPGLRKVLEEDWKRLRGKL